MPERNGYEVAAFIKGSPTLSHIPVVLLTGAFEPIDESRARAVGCDGVLVKPFEPQMVISRVKDLLAGRRPTGLWGGAPAAQGPVRAALRPVRSAPFGRSLDQWRSARSVFRSARRGVFGQRWRRRRTAPGRCRRRAITRDATRSHSPLKGHLVDRGGRSSRPGIRISPAKPADRP